MTSAPAPVGIVLAAGAGTRMGMPKALVVERGMPWLQTAVEVLGQGGCTRVIVVLGARAAEAAPLLPPDVAIVVAADWRSGMAASLTAALGAAIQTDAPAAVITLVDLPALPAAAVARVLSPSPGRASLRQAYFAGVPGHPVVIGRDHWHPLLASISGDEGAKRYLDSHGAERIDCTELGSGVDVDTPEQLVAETTDDALLEVVRALRAAGCVYAEEEADLLMAAASSATELQRLVGRRVEGIPLEYILGWAEFCGLRIAVEPGVFVPRGRTELLVREAAARISPTSVVVDMCCGSGAVATVLADSVLLGELWAADIDPRAVACARRNLGGRASVAEGDLFGALPRSLRGRIDVVVANAPYVPTDAIGLMPPEARIHEARVALDGGSDGLELHRRLAAEASAWLVPGGWLLVETSEDQASTSLEILELAGFDAEVKRSEEVDGTAVMGQLRR